MADLFLTPYVRTVWQLLSHRLGGAKPLCLFGGGAHTRWLLSAVEGLDGPAVACIIDDDPKEAFIHGIAVRRPDEVDIESVGAILISSDRWEAELSERCRALWGNSVEIVRLYANLPIGPYDKTDDRAEALRRVGGMDRCRPADDRLVVMVSDYPGSREAKMGLALQSAGWQTVLLHRTAATFDTSHYFHIARTYGDAWEALRLACDYSPVVYHVMVNSDYRVAEHFLRHRPGVVVVDSYDLMAGMYTAEAHAAHPEWQDEAQRERYCLERADGVCCRSEEADYLAGSLGYQYRRQVLFPDYCWNEPLPLKRSGDERLHIAYVGKVANEVEQRDPFAASGYRMWLAKAMSEQGLHFHLHPSVDAMGGAFDEVYAEYRELERTTQLFTLHRPVTPDRLVGVLSQYDLGIHVFNEFAAPPSGHDVFEPAKFRYSSANKLFDYIDAGLPIVHNLIPDSFQARIVGRHDSGIDVGKLGVCEWGRRIRDIDTSQLCEHVRTARCDYDVRSHVSTLTSFYLDLRTRAASDATRSDHPSREPINANCGREHRQAVV